jgi:hypothetical protein
LFGRNGGNVFTIDRGPNNGTRLTMNGESVEFPDGFIRDRIDIIGVGVVVGDTGSGNDTVNIEDVPAGLRVFVTLGHGPNNVVNLSPVAHNLDNIRGPVDLSNGLGVGIPQGQVFVHDDLNSSTTRWSLSGDAISGKVVRTGAVVSGDISFEHFQQITIQGSSGTNNYTFLGNEGSSNTTLNTGTGGGSIDIEGTNGPLTINGNPGYGLQINHPGVHGTLTLTGFPGSFSRVDINDGADRANRANVVLTDRSLIGLGRADIFFAPGSVALLTITGGDGNNTYTIANTPSSAAAGGSQTVLNTGGGTDTVNVQATTGPLTVNGGGSAVVQLGTGSTLTGLNGLLTLNNVASSVPLILDDRADTSNHPNAVLTATSLTGLTPEPINFASALPGLTITGGSGTNNYTIANTPAGIPTTLNTGNGNDTVTVLGSNPNAPLTVNAGSGTHAVNVGNGSLAGLFTPVTLNDPTSTFHLNVDDSADTTNRDANNHPMFLTDTGLSMAGAGIIFGASSLAGLTINGGSGNNLYEVLNTPSTAVVLKTGNGDDVVEVFRTAAGGPLVVNAGGRGNDFVIVGDPTLGLATIRGTVQLNNPTSFSHVNIIDGTDTTGHPNVQLTSTSLTGLAAPIGFGANSLDGLTITGGNGNNTWTIISTPSSRAPVGDPTTLNTGLGHDTINVLGVAASAPLTVNTGNPAGTDVINVGIGGSLGAIQGTLTLNGLSRMNIDDSADTTSHPNVVLTDRSLTGLTPGGTPINFGLDSAGGLTITGGAGNNTYTVANTPGPETDPVLLNTGSGNDTVTVLGTNFNAPLTVNGGRGTQVVNVGNNGSLASFFSAVTVNDPFATAHLTVDDSADPTPRSTTFAPIVLTDTSLNLADIHFGANALAGLTILGGRGTNLYLVENTPSTAVVLNTGNGDDEVDIFATAARGSRTVNAGGRGNDHVNVGPNSSLAGIQGTVRLNNNLSFSHVSISDTADTTDPQPFQCEENSG